MLKGFVVTFMALATLGFSNASQAQTPHAAGDNPASVHAGEQVFIQRCFQCHSVQEDQVKFGPSLFNEMKKPHPKKTATEIRTILKDGKGKMPSFKDVLTQEDTDNLLAYIHSL